MSPHPPAPVVGPLRGGCRLALPHALLAPGRGRAASSSRRKAERTTPPCRSRSGTRADDPCAVASAVAGTKDGQEYLETLWEELRASAPDADLDPAAEAAEVEQAQAQARLDGLVRQVKVSRDE